jgi:hypothetical protein
MRFFFAQLILNPHLIRATSKENEKRTNPIGVIMGVGSLNIFLFEF